MLFFEPNKTCIILDIEGNSASRKEERKMTQFSALIINGEKIQEVNMLNRNVNYISPYVQRLTHISLKKCKNVGFAERHMVKEIYQILAKVDIIYAYGFDFDKQILQDMFKKYRFKKIEKNWIDIQPIVKEQLNPTRLSLSVAAKEYGFEDTHFHNALVDCYAILHLIRCMEKKEVFSL